MPYKNPLHQTRRNKRYYQEHKLEHLKKHKLYYQENKEDLLEKMKQYYKGNKEQVKKYQKEYFQKNRKMVLGKQIKYREKNKEEINRKEKVWRGRNRNKRLLYFCKYKNLGCNLTEEILGKIISKPCYYCGEQEKLRGLDRVNSAKGYFLNNVVSCCLRCNRMKSYFPQQDFLNHCKKIINYCEMSTPKSLKK